MKSRIIATAAFLLTISSPVTAQASNYEEIKQLLATNKCPNCNLRNAGLVMADLSGANLSGANLAGANLSRANLSGADLRGANLSGTSLFGVNLSEAKLSGANLTGADLRNTYLMNVELTDANLTGTNFQGAVGIPSQIAKPEDFYGWGVAAAEKGNLKPAIDYFSQAIALKPDYAGAYLSRGVASYQSLDRKSALVDAQIAAKLFDEQKNPEGLQTAQAFILELKTPYGEKVSTGKPSFMDFVGSLGSVLLQFLPF
ncbi:pentapeptide repeat-containing protein [Anabaena sphaerica FACHB-251]|uniref:Pentapeptide repeat-containing protein n=1 Tax=Anabaena sphaerica FACHB-251 TaxID=2692883 RepID=A0A926WI94_9NOST|nr:pentapeptide repeat-containing protein [Anabaena sphaerica]MBD2294978.1 pentapeptide repeat-containing protein [Anabaena sphaerica FACHB-251]